MRFRDDTQSTEGKFTEDLFQGFNDEPTMWTYIVALLQCGSK